MLPLQLWNAIRGKSDGRDTTPAADDVAVSSNGHITSTESISTSISFEEKYSLLSEYGGHILCIISERGRCEYLSRNFDTITGLQRAFQVDKSLYNIMHGDFHARFEHVLETAKAVGSTQSMRCKLKHSDDKYQWYQFQIHTRDGSDQNDFVCVIENIHDVIMAQHTLQKARLDAELALRARSEFLANMSHELRTPLNAVLGFAQIIESEIFGKINNQQYKDYICHIQDSGYDLLTKIEDLLEIANIDAGRVSLSKEEVMLSDILRHVIQAQTHHANSADVVIECPGLPRDVPLFVDRLKLQHILGHLVSNAIRHSAKDSTIELTAVQDANGMTLTVRDQGAGMDPSRLSTILTALQEDNCWTNANEHGTIGLGLALTREFVMLHGGQVDLDSVVGEGTTISIFLPKPCIRDINEQSSQLKQAANS